MVEEGRGEGRERLSSVKTVDRVRGEGRRRGGREGGGRFHLLRVSPDFEEGVEDVRVTSEENFPGLFRRRGGEGGGRVGRGREDVSDKGAEHSERLSEPHCESLLFLFAFPTLFALLPFPPLLLLLLGGREGDEERGVGDEVESFQQHQNVFRRDTVIERGVSRNDTCYALYYWFQNKWDLLMYKWKRGSNKIEPIEANVLGGRLKKTHHQRLQKHL